MNVSKRIRGKLGELAFRLFPIKCSVCEPSPGTTLSYNKIIHPIHPNGAPNSTQVNTPHTLRTFHYYPSFFPNPASFQPKRWVDPDQEISQSYFRTFDRDPRACLEKNLAQDELLCTIRDFDFDMIETSVTKELQVNRAVIEELCYAIKDHLQIRREGDGANVIVW